MHEIIELYYLLKEFMAINDRKISYQFPSLTSRKFRYNNYMHKIIIIFIVIFSTQVYSQEIRDIITDPAVSRRCKFLIKQRNKKVNIQQRLNSLLQRNEKLLQRVKDQEKTIKTKLEFSKTRIRNTLSLTKLKIRKMEENIVRKGCPGIAL
jgi:hypothetical protein